MSEPKNIGENTGGDDLRPAPGGGALRTGNPGNSGGKKGRSGRKPDAFKEHMQSLATGRKVEAYLKRCLAGEFGPKFFLSALQYATDHGYGRATQAVELTGAEGGPLEVTVTRRIVRPDANG